MNEKANQAIADFLTAIGIDYNTEEMKQTPQRVVKLFEKLFSGVNENPAKLLSHVYPTEYAGLVAVTNIPFKSVCEHHLMPFLGTVDVVYHPRNGQVVGFSKMEDLVNLLAHRPQLQERLTQDIAKALMDNLAADGVMVRIKAEHFCMILQGEMQMGSQIITFSSEGSLANNGEMRDEGLLLLGGKIDE